MSPVNVAVTFQQVGADKTQAKFKVLQILVSVGQNVKERDSLFEIETEKAVFEFESPVEGVIREIFLSADPDKEHSYNTVFCTIEVSP